MCGSHPHTYTSEVVGHHLYSNCKADDLVQICESGIVHHLGNKIVCEGWTSGRISYDTVCGAMTLVSLILLVVLWLWFLISFLLKQWLWLNTADKGGSEWWQFVVYPICPVAIILFPSQRVFSLSVIVVLTWGKR